MCYSISFFIFFSNIENRRLLPRVTTSPGVPFLQFKSEHLSILINDIIMSSDKFNFILYADDTTLNATVESFRETTADIHISIRNELQKICKWLDLNKLRLNVAKSKFMLFHMPQKMILQLHFYLNGSPIVYLTEFNSLGLTLDCNLNFSHI